MPAGEWIVYVSNYNFASSDPAEPFLQSYLYMYDYNRRKSPIFINEGEIISNLQDLDIILDIKPGTCKNPLNIGSKGVLPVAVLGSAGFDVSVINPASIRLIGVEPLRSAVEDVAAPADSAPGNDGGQEHSRQAKVRKTFDIAEQM
jgi:hypothetical protein